MTSEGEATAPAAPSSGSGAGAEHAHRPRGGRTLPLALGALGIVFGDIGTSPLYAMQTVFSLEHNTVQATRGDVLGVISMVVWSITLVVSMKYVALAMRADNDGEGGILALVALLRRHLHGTRRLAVVMAMGVLGAALFYGDAVITPAISVMSAIEGLEVAQPSLAELVLPLAVVVLSGLFVIQRWGTGVVGKAFGPVMVLWFAVLLVLGLPHIVMNPEILEALSPTYAVAFVLENPFIAFVAMGGVVLTITGAEALYADMGHFGARSIRLSWYLVVFPALAVNYLGQGAMILEDPSVVSNPFFLLAPSWATLPLVVLATVATVIASQAVISGAFSVSRQAVRLGMLPRLAVRQTSREEGGQIYVPVMNWILFVGVIVLTASFGSSSRLAAAYGLAVTGTLLLTSALFLLLAKYVWRVETWKVVVYVVLVVAVELTFLGANMTKVVSGGWLPLVIATFVVALMTTWRRGAEALHAEERVLEGPLPSFLRIVREHPEFIRRVPGVAVFPHANATTTPLALRANADFNQVVHERVVLVQIVNENVPHIRHVDRVEVDDLGDPGDGFVHVTVHVGFTDSQDIPKGLALAVGMTPELDIDLDEAHYFLSVITVQATGHRGLRTWRKRLYAWMYHNAANRTEVFHLPPDRTIVMGAHIEL
ncbi:potassium transporter Kup [Humibacillus xanthopallidus]|uniref:potassium transporter Kup n=1 Tax=Humibacillus xanthopallidus TaxID=412689 RepID=UPI0021AB153F|nr:KUP/HAK/KT family potassium transporter [Humibacillus xanthopallidus]